MDESEINALTVDLLPLYFRERIEVRGECWIWTAHVMANGYGWCMLHPGGVNGGNTSQAHRATYQHLVGHPGENLHHWLECDTRCVRPAHLHPITASAHTTLHHTQLHCDRGHPMEDAYVVHRSNGQVTRMCSHCAKAVQQRMRDKAKVAAGLPLHDLRYTLTPQDLSVLRERRLGGASIAELADEFDVTVAHLSRVLKDESKVVRGGRYRDDGYMTPELESQIMDEIRSTSDTYELIGKRFGIAKHRINQIAKKHGVDGKLRRQHLTVPKKLELTFRRLKGDSAVAVAEQFGVSPSRVKQVVRECRPRFDQVEIDRYETVEAIPTSVLGRVHIEKMTLVVYRWSCDRCGARGDENQEDAAVSASGRHDLECEPVTLH